MSAFANVAAASLWSSLKLSGMLDEATITSGESTFGIDVGFIRPDRERFNGSMASAEYQIEYQQRDAPDLAEGDVVVVGSVSYRVRSDPFVADDGTASEGFFRKALLTKGVGALRNEDGSLILTEAETPINF